MAAGMKKTKQTLQEVRMKCFLGFPTFSDCGMIQLWAGLLTTGLLLMSPSAAEIKRDRERGNKTNIIQPEPDIAASENRVSCTLEHFQ